MLHKRTYALLAILGSFVFTAAQVAAQAPARGGARAPNRARGGGRPPAYPQRETDPAAAARGKAIFQVQCGFCHGEDARGGDGGPNLIRSELVLSDDHGEAIAPVIQNGRVAQGMPKFDLKDNQISDIAAFIHSFRVLGYDASRHPPETIVVGDAKAGEAFFKEKCASCHSVTGDLKGIAARITDPRALQQRWVMPTGGGGRGRGGSQSKPVTVTVTYPSGQKVEGELNRIDDFLVTVTKDDGTRQTIRRDGDTPKVEIHDPAEPHKRLLPTYTDKNVHDVTAYLVTLK